MNAIRSNFPLRAAPLALLPLILSSGCAPTAKRPDTPQRIAAATGLSNAITVQQHGMPLDVKDDAAETLTLAQAVQRSVERSPDLQAALARTRAAEADANQAALLPNPILSLLFRFPEGSGKPVIEAGLTADLVTILQRPGRVSAADNRLRAASANAVAICLDVLTEAQKQYAEVQTLDALLPVLLERGKLLDHLIELAQARLNQGEGTRLDVTILQTQRIELEVEIAEKQLDQRRARLALARMIGQPSADATWKLTPWEEPPQIAVAESVCVKLALQHRAEVDAQRWELAALGADLRLSRWAIFDGNDIGVGAERDEVWTVGPAVTIPLPLFDWGQAKVAKAQVAALEARHKLTRIGREVIEQVRGEYAAFDASRRTLALARDKLLPAQERRRNDTEAAYRGGQTDITALILAEQDLQTSRTKLIELQQKTSLAFYRLQRAVGGPGFLEVQAAPPATRPTTSTTRATDNTPLP